MKRFKGAISLKEAAVFCGCSEDVLNVHVRRGKLKAIKIGRNWATTHEWLNEYLRTRKSETGRQGNFSPMIFLNPVKKSAAVAAVFYAKIANIKITKNHARLAVVACGAALVFFGVVGAASFAVPADLAAAGSFPAEACKNIGEFFGGLKRQDFRNIELADKWSRLAAGFLKNLDDGVQRFGNNPLGSSAAFLKNDNPRGLAAVSGLLAGTQTANYTFNDPSAFRIPDFKNIYFAAVKNLPASAGVANAAVISFGDQAFAGIGRGFKISAGVAKKIARPIGDFSALGGRAARAYLQGGQASLASVFGDFGKPLADAWNKISDFVGDPFGANYFAQTYPAGLIEQMKIKNKNKVLARQNSIVTSSAGDPVSAAAAAIGSGKGLTAAGAVDRPLPPNLAPVRISQTGKPDTAVHTITERTFTVVADQELKDQVNRLLRQMNPDRPNFSVGQPTVIPSNLSSETLNIDSGNFAVTAGGDITAASINASGNVEVAGNFTLSGTMASDGIASFSASSTAPILALAQGGSGLSLQADDITIKGRTIAATEGNNVQFYNASNYIDASGNLVVAGNITPYQNIAQDIGSATNQFNNIYSKTINTAAINTSGQGVFNFSPATTAFGDSTLLINPTTAPAGSILLGIGTGGASKFTVDSGGNVAGGTYNGLSLAPQTTGFSIAGGTTGKTLTVDADGSASNWNTAFGWGNWAHTTLAGYGITDALGLHGTADRATALANARNINGVSFDGTADITVAADANTLTGSTLNSTILASSLTSVGTLANLTVTNPIAGSVTGNAATVTNGVYTNAANSFSLINPLTTPAESWIGPSSTAGIYFKGGNVGIGTTSPGAKLEVNGNMFSNGGSSAAGSVLVGQVSNYPGVWFGSNTANPSVTNYGLLYDGVSTGIKGTILNTPSGQNFSFRVANSNQMAISSTGGVAIGSTYANLGVDPGVNNLIVQGNVGIGTTGPGSRLTVTDSNPPVSFERTTTETNVLKTSGTLKLTTTGDMADGFGPSFNFQIRDSAGVDNYIGGFGVIRDGADNSGAVVFAPYSAGVSTERMRISSAGNVGIGTTGPSHKLDVAGDFYASATSTFMGNVGIGTAATAYPLYVNGAIYATGSIWGTPRTSLVDSSYISAATNLNLTSGASAYVNVNGSLYAQSSGNVGIGTTSPSYKLDVNGTLNASATSTFAGRVGIGTTAPAYDLDVAGTVNAGVFRAIGDIGAQTNTIKMGLFNGFYGLYSTGTNDMGFSHYRNSAYVTDMVIKGDSGNVGIGTTAPGYKLHVSDSGVISAVIESSNSLWAGFEQRATVSGARPFIQFYNSADNKKAWIELNPTTSVLGFVMPGSATPKMVIDSSGNVGIGTTGPVFPLDVVGAIHTSSYFQTGANVVINDTLGMYYGTRGGYAFGANVGTGAAPLVMSSGNGSTYTGGYLAFKTDGGERVRIDSSGNVGIGTTGPGDKLEIYSTTKPSFTLSNGDATTKTRLSMGGTGKSALYSLNYKTSTDVQDNTSYASWVSYLGTDDVDQFSINRIAAGGNWAARTTPLYINSTGNVGIGTTAPGKKLEVKQSNDTDGFRLYGYTVPTSYFDFYVNSLGNPRFATNGSLVFETTGTNYFRGSSFNVQGPDATTSLFYVNSSSNSGNVGIGTTSPLSKLHSKESGAKTAANYAGYLENIATNATTDNISKYGMYITSTGDFSGSSGTATNNYGLYIDTISGGDNNYGLVVKTIPTTSNVANVSYDSATGIFYYNASSERFKSGIKDLAFDYNKVLSLSPKQWTLNSDNSLGIGFVAEDLEKLNLPELVVYNSAGQPDGIQWNRITTYMLGVLKDQQNEIGALKLALDANGGIANATSTAQFASASGGITQFVIDTLQSLGMALKDGVATLKGLVVDTLTAKHVNTDQICVKDSGNNDICLTGDQLKELINKAGSSVTVNQTFTAPVVPAVDTPLTVETGTATTTEEIAQ